MKVLVTGAAGFLGSHVVRRLHGDPRYRVLRGQRDAARASEPQPSPGAEPGVVRLDVTDPASLAAAMQDVDAVVHCAVGNRDVTVDGTRRVCEAAGAAGVQRVVHVSSIAVYGQARGRVTESTPLIPTGRGYAAWKADAERACLAADGVDVVRLRPTIVYGTHSPLWVDAFLRRIRSGRWGTLGAAGEGTCNPVHVDDVADCIALALEAGAQVAGRAFNVNGPETLTWNAWFTTLAETAGLGQLAALTPATIRRRQAIAVPLKALRRAVPAFDPDFLLGVPAGGESALFALDATYPTDAATDALGWRPRIGIAEGVAAAVAGARR